MMRVGFGYDVHRLVQGDSLILGGVQIPFKQGLEGHSDADVLLHAIIDALLGAAGLGDIGTHFPDTDEAYRDADSVTLLSSAAKLLRDHGYIVGNIDATVVAEAPKLRSYIDRMRARIAGAADMAVGQVSVKATTSEGLGFVGTRAGIAAYAICAIFSGDSEAASFLTPEDTSRG